MNHKNYDYIELTNNKMIKATQPHTSRPEWNKRNGKKPNKKK